ncbi:WD40-repeat-containing domain [Pseudocohnilembus persalinus]|uniref:Serine/threonine-protein phosphatase 2A 55 kDa regulatory subunit B n=1 Tax=Pseudocohnilembus persalinus TaxID=266149 RepID=A0A0V0R9K7_PSEPJ|nr:WD40-repeat-containing domain [Pseudocohnilembus persalinus]|eukprot:KRX11177.1 WD40-repeat-containing domain [Pseudocohnilembus persalinus]
MKQNGISKIDWKFTQVFGDKASSEKVQEEDIISAIQFDNTGKYLSLGDRAGRLIVFEMYQHSKSKRVEYQYLTELQSHTREFDYLKSTDIEEKINQICWLNTQGKNMYCLTTNDKTIKLWKISERNIKKIVKSSSNKDYSMPKLQTVESGIMPTIRKVYPNLHTYHINQISTSQNEDFMLSSDDLRVYLWSLEQPNKAFIAVDLKPDNLDELSEVITSSQFHPIQDNQFLYTTSKGIAKIGDMRQSGICDNTAITLSEKEDPSKKNFFTEIVASISDATFSKNGRYIFSRDFLNVKVWDVNMANKPVVTIPIFEPLKSKLCELYENECIFDKFSIQSSPCGNYFTTGNFNSSFHVIDRFGENNLQFELNFNKKTMIKQIPQKYFENLGPNYEFSRKVLKSAYHPNQHIIAAASLNCLFFYSGSVQSQ